MITLQPFFYDRESQEDHGRIWNFVRERKMEFSGVSLYDFFDWEFCRRAILSTFLIQYYGLRTIWFVSLVLTLFLSGSISGHIQYVRRDG